MGLQYGELNLNNTNHAKCIQLHNYLKFAKSMRIGALWLTETNGTAKCSDACTKRVMMTWEDYDMTGQ